MKRLKKRILTALIILQSILVLFSPSPTYSQVKRMTIDDAIQAAVDNNHDAQAARLNVRKADAAVSEALGYAMPSVNLSGQYTYNLKSPVFFMPNFFQGKYEEFVPVKIAADNAFQGVASLSQILFNSAVFQGIGTAKIYYSAVVEQYKSQISKTILSTQKIFYGVLLAKEFHETMKNSLKHAEENLESIRAFYNEGMIPEFDKIRAEVAVENIRPMVLQAESGYVNALNGLKITLGMDMKDSVEVIGELNLSDDSAEPDISKALSEIESSNYDIAALKKMRDVNQDLISIRSSEFFPTLALFGNYIYQGQSNTFDFMTATSSSVGLSLSLNVFSGFQSLARVQQAKIDFMTIDERYRQLRDVLIMQLKNSAYNLNIARKRIAAVQQTVSQAERGYEISKIRYKEGVGSLMEINDADNSLMQARVNRSQAYYDYITSKAEYISITGKVDKKYLRDFD